jgi:glutaredoxin
MEGKRRVRVVLYSKPGCHLCEEMKEEMNRAGCSELYELEEVNIEDDPDLSARYRYEIPVLRINGVEAFRYHLRADEFRNYLTELVKP